MVDYKLYYNNLPKGWINYCKDDFSISQEKYKQVKNKLLALNNVIVIYMQNACKLFVPILLQENKKVFGIDFIDYFDSVFKQDREYDIVENSDFYVIYNIGLEKALNTDFSSRMLLGLIEKLKANDKIVILCSHLPFTEFYKKYQIDIVNKIQIKEKKESPIF